MRAALVISCSLTSLQSTDHPQVRQLYLKHSTLVSKTILTVHKWFELHHATSYETWNTRLLMSTREFGAAHPDATIMICSAKAVFNAILDFPEDYGFQASDSRAASGGIWYDHLHPTSAMHEHVASHLADFLDGVPSANSN